MYTPLNIKTDNYLLNSMIKIDDLVMYAVNHNIKSLTITDNNMYGVIEFYKKCKSYNIKPIVGLEIKLDDYIIILYCMNYDGYLNLIKLSTIMSERLLNINDLDRYSSNLIAIVPFDSISIYDKLFFYKYIYKSYKNDVEKSKLTGNTIYMNKICCLKKEDTSYLKYLEAIREGITANFVETDYSDNYLKMDIDDNGIIYDLCNLELPFNQKLMPKYNDTDGMDSFSYLKKLCIQGLRNHFGNVVGINYKDRLKYELDIINKMGFCDYFLIVYDYVKYARDNNIIVGSGRGSAVGSLVSYCLGITDVDPIKYNLIFERFLNPERVSMPDIDIDFEHLKREDMINYCISKYGEKRVAPIIAFGTLASKQAIRDVGRCLNVDLKLIDSLCKLIDSKKSLDDNYKANSKLRDLLSRKKELDNIYKIAYKFEGIKRHTTIHAAGIIMSCVDLDSVIPLDKSHGVFYTTGYDMTYLEEIGLLKMDFLAIKYLTIIHNIIDSINKYENVNIKFDDIPLNDSDALKIFECGDTVGIFQFESDGMINFLKKLKPNSLDDIFAAIALFRPGPMKNIPLYIKRKNGEEKIDYYDDSLKDILEPTYGIMIYQEQIMMIANVMADYTLGEADILRKAMSKKKRDLLLKEEEKFTRRSLAKGYSLDLVKKVYGLMLKFAEYGFNKSHSVGYSIVAYKMAYLKAHYRKYFITNLLSMDSGSVDKIKLYIYEAKSNGINILKPDINLSDRDYVIEDGGIRYPFNIKNVGLSAINIILDERSRGLFTSIYDFIRRCYGKSVNRKILESLILGGFFDSFRYNRKTLYTNLDVIVNYGDLIKDMEPIYDLTPDIKEVSEFSNKELMNYEYELYGFYLSNHPVSEIKAKYKNIVNLNNINGYFDKVVDIIVSVDRVREVITKKQDKMLFVTGSDELSIIDIVLFPKIYSVYNDISKDDILLIRGRVEKRFDSYQIIASKIEKLKEEI